MLQVSLVAFSANWTVPGFIMGLDQLLTQTNISTVKSYLAWNLVRSTGSHLSKPFEDEKFAWSHIFLGLKEPPARYYFILPSITS